MPEPLVLPLPLEFAPEELAPEELAPEEFDPEEFDPEEFDLEEFDLEEFDLEEFDLEEPDPEELDPDAVGCSGSKLGSTKKRTSDTETLLLPGSFAKDTLTVTDSKPGCLDS